jgi:hypothetical protein
MMSLAQLEVMFGASIKFVPELSNEVFSLYAVKASGNRHLFDVVVNNLTREIKVVFADMTEVELDVKVQMKLAGEKETFPPQPVYRPSSSSVKSIIYPRIISLLADKLTG